MMSRAAGFFVAVLLGSAGPALAASGGHAPSGPAANERSAAYRESKGFSSKEACNAALTRGAGGNVLGPVEGLSGNAIYISTTSAGADLVEERRCIQDKLYVRQWYASKVGAGGH